METIIFIGSAGAGKSSLTKSFSDFLEKKGYSVFKANFDPACEYIPYKPDFDIRNFYSIENIMKEEKIGPNLAIIKIYEYLSSDSRVKEIVSNIEKDYIVVDTAGQLEIFLLRDTGEKFINIFKNPVVFLLVDAGSIKEEDLVTIRLLSVVASLKLSADVLPIISKADAVENVELLENIEYFDELIEKLRTSERISDIALDMLSVLEKYRTPIRPVAVSIREEDSLERLLDLLFEVRCVCGDLT